MDKGMYYCLEHGGHILYQPLVLVRVGQEGQKHLYELMCKDHAQEWTGQTYYA
jgi:hypothetical protein